MRTRVVVFSVSTLLGAVVLACASGSLLQAPAGSPTPAANSATPAAATTAAQPTLISMVQLLADPQKYHGKQVQVIGFAHFEFEGNAIYLSKEDHDYGITKNGLWLAVAGSKDGGELRDLNNSYVVVEGTINAEMKGHMGMWSGSIENITLLKRWAKR
jgi:hypothetical protein